MSITPNLSLLIRGRVYFILVFFSVTFLGRHALTAGDVSSSSECKAWQSIRETLMSKDSLNVTCIVNRVCTGLACNGAYVFTKMPEMTKFLNGLDVKVSFEIEFITCSNPLNASVYIDLEGETLTKVITVDPGHQIENIPIPGSASYGLINVSAELNFGLNHTFTATDAQQRLVNLEMNVTLAIEFRLLNGSVMPAAKKSLVLIPPVDVPIPECRAEGHVVPVKPSGPNNDSYTGVKCVPDTHGQCGDHQACRASSSGAVAMTTGRCACWVGLVWDSQSQVCVEKVPAYATPTGNQSNAKSIAMIIGIIVTVLIVVAVAVVIVVKYRHYRQRYGQHDLLATTDNEPIDEDDDAQMLPA